MGYRGGRDSWSSRLELEAKVDAKRLALEEGVHEDEPELFLDVEKKNCKSSGTQLLLGTRMSEILFDMKPIILFMHFYYKTLS